MTAKKIALFARTEILFALLTLLFGSALVFLNPPLRAPDESGHFARAYQFATLGLTAVTTASFSVPADPDLAGDFAYWQNQAEAHTGKTNPLHYSPAEIWAGFSTHHPATETPTTLALAQPQALMLPFAYFPQALTMYFGIQQNASFLGLLYMARFINFLFCFLITLAAMRIMPYGKELLAAASLLPMAVFERSQLSTDGLLMASAGLALAVMLGLYERAKTKTPVQSYALYLALLVSLVGIALCKSTYLCIFVLWFLLIAPNKKMIALGGVIMLPALLISLWWGHFLSLHDYRILNGEHAGMLDPTEKYHLLLHAPQEAALRIVRTLWRHIFDWAGQMVGVFGFMDVVLALPLRFLGFFWLASLVYWTTDTKPQLKNWQGLLLIGIFGLQVVLVLLTIFLIWADPASPYIGGVQGRYFLPLLPCFLLGLSTFMPQRAITARQRLILTPACFLLLCATVTIGAREWGI